MGIFTRQNAAFDQRLRILPHLQKGVFYTVIHTAAFTENHHRIRRQILHTCRDLRINSGQITIHTAGCRTALQSIRILPQTSNDALCILLLGQFVS